jgi:hypothetical protein
VEGVADQLVDAVRTVILGGADVIDPCRDRGAQNRHGGDRVGRRAVTSGPANCIARYPAR